MKIVMLPHQLEFLESDYEVVAASCGRGAGKSFMAAAAGATHLKKGDSGLLIGPTFEDCDIIINFIIDFLSATHTKFIHHKSKHYLKLRNGGTLYYRTAETERGIRGKTNLSFLIMDEAAMSSRKIYMLALMCLRGAKVRKRKIYLISTPRGKANWFYDVCMSDKCHLVKANTRSNTFLGEEFVEMLQEQVTDKELLKQELEAAWLDLTACPVFEESLLETMLKPSQSSSGKVVVGIDVATGGDNSSACVMRGNEIIKIHAQKTTADVGTLINMAHASLGGLVPDYFVIDSTGVGAFAPVEFKRVWPDSTVIPVNFSEKSYKPGYANRRAEIYFDLRTRIQTGLRYGSQVSDDIRSKVWKQALATEYMLGGKSILTIVPKKDIKMKTGSSPDELDSVVLAACVDVNALTHQRSSSAPVPTMPLSIRRN